MTELKKKTLYEIANKIINNEDIDTNENELMYIFVKTLKNKLNTDEIKDYANDAELLYLIFKIKLKIKFETSDEIIYARIMNYILKDSVLDNYIYSFGK